MESVRRKRMVRITLLSVLGAAVLVFVWALDSVFGPLLFALLLAYILNPVVNWIQRLGIRRGLAIGVLFLAFYASLLGFLLLTVPAFVSQVGSLYQSIVGESVHGSFYRPELPQPEDGRRLVRLQAPVAGFAAYLDKDEDGEFRPERGDVEAARRDVGLTAKQAESYEVERWDRLIRLEPPWQGEYHWYTDRNENGRYDPGYARAVAVWLQELKRKFAERTSDSETFQTGLEELRRKVVGSGTAALDVVLSTTANAIFTVFGFLTAFVLIPIYLFYFLLGLSSIRDRAVELLPGRHRERILEILRHIDEAVSAFFRGRLVIMAIKGIVTALALWVLGVPFALVLGVITGVGSLIPIAGFLMGLVPAVSIALLDSGSIGLGLIVALVFVVIEVLENYLLTPWILKDRVGLHPITLIVSVFVAGAVFGFVGMLLAVPMAAVLKILYREFVLPEIRILAAEKPD